MALRRIERAAKKGGDINKMTLFRAWQRLTDVRRSFSRPRYRRTPPSAILSHGRLASRFQEAADNYLFLQLSRGELSCGTQPGARRAECERALSWKDVSLSPLVLRLGSVHLCNREILRVRKAAPSLGDDFLRRSTEGPSFASRFGFLRFRQTVGRRRPAGNEPNMSVAEATFSSGFCARMNYRGGLNANRAEEIATDSILYGLVVKSPPIHIHFNLVPAEVSSKNDDDRSDYFKTSLRTRSKLTI